MHGLAGAGNAQPLAGCAGGAAGLRMGGRGQRAGNLERREHGSGRPPARLGANMRLISGRATNRPIRSAVTHMIAASMILNQ